MKLYSNPIPSSRATQRGFALIVTLSLMILLTVIAVGLLTLSTISIRASSQGRAEAIAKANARLALMLAIGDLQKNAGPDQRITATGSIIEEAGATGTVKLPNIAGVWESWKINPNAMPSANDYKKSGGKDSRFLSWLVSAPLSDSTTQQDFVKTVLPENEEVTLMRASTVGATNYPKLVAGLVTMKDPSREKPSGGYAWAVMDEGTKARIDSGFRESKSTRMGDQAMALGSGKRADSARVQELDAFTWAKSDLNQSDYKLGSGISLATMRLLDEKLAGNANDKIKELDHDITVDSLGLFTDVANGGLKQDLNSILNDNTLPADLNEKGIYESQLSFPVAKGATIGYPEPSWAPLQKFSNLYQSVATNGTVPYIAAAGPVGWNVSAASNPPPAAVNPVLMPTISKIQIFYSLVACPLRSGNNTDADKWVFSNDKAFKEAWDNKARYLLYLVYTPVVTLHNPYNTTLFVPKLSVEFKNVPMTVQISRIGPGSNPAFLPADGGAVQSFYQGGKNMGYTKSFKFTLKNAAGNNTALLLQPGELVAFSPDIPTTASFQSERGPGTDAKNRTFVDTQDSGATGGGVISGILDTSKQNARRGFRGIAAGYALDYLNYDGNNLADPPYNPTPISGFRFSGVNDSFRIKFRPTSDSRANKDKGVFSVVMSDGNTSSYTALNFDFSGPTSGKLSTGLEEALDLDSGGQIYPATDEPALSIDKIRVFDPLRPDSETRIIDFPSNAFAVVTATAKTTLADQDGTNYEGRYATKPWSFNAPMGDFVRQKIQKGSSVHQAQYPYELDVVALSPSTGHGGDDYVIADALGRGIGITGQTSAAGKQFATAYEIPLAPPQALPQLNSANLANGNSLSRFLYPIGNSWAHPMISTAQISQAAPLAGLANQYDHSFLLNLSLYDSFYFSGIAPSGGSKFMEPVTTNELAKDFFSSNREKTVDDRLTAYIPEGKTLSEATAALANPATARKEAAAYQVMKGAFNVNSTSKEAWKAMLASIHADKSQANAIDPAVTTGFSTAESLEAVESDKVRFSRFRVPNSVTASGSAGTDAQTFFLGSRDISDSQLDTLAEKIVEQVKTRGPFLSMAEFVNRQLGPSSELTLKGALQAAIDQSGINTDSGEMPALNETGYEIASTQVADYGFASPDAAIGRSDQGAPGNLSQSDLLVALGNAATVRSDTFRIRSYGEARDSSGAVTARAWCEAVVQRTPDFVSSENPPQTPVAGLTPENASFGRAFVVTSFRWLNSTEVQ